MSSRPIGHLCVVYVSTMRALYSPQPARQEPSFVFSLCREARSSISSGVGPTHPPSTACHSTSALPFSASPLHPTQSTSSVLELLQVIQPRPARLLSLPPLHDRTDGHEPEATKTLSRQGTVRRTLLIVTELIRPGLGMVTTVQAIAGRAAPSAACCVAHLSLWVAGLLGLWAHIYPNPSPRCGNH